MIPTPLHDQITSLPSLLENISEKVALSCQQLFTHTFTKGIEHIFITGCGDSHHAAICTQLAFQQLTGLNCCTMPAMQFARYQAPFLSQLSAGKALVIGLSVSGQVTRTIEALDLAKIAGATTIALTGNPASELAQVADYILEATVPSSYSIKSTTIVPGCQSFMVSLVTLFHSSIQIGSARNYHGNVSTRKQQEELAAISGLMARTLDICDPVVTDLVSQWRDADHFVFCGAGPNFGAALYSAAKMLEASGDAVTAQDLEEWAHLEFFGRQVDTPTLILSGGRRDQDRAKEVFEAAIAIGRRVAMIASADSSAAKLLPRSSLLTIEGQFSERFSPLLTTIPGMLFASARAELLGEAYFRNFSGGRSQEGGGGISRIQTSHRINQIIH